jgi:hypothetical protein
VRQAVPTAPRASRETCSSDAYDAPASGRGLEPDEVTRILTVTAEAALLAEPDVE